MISRLAAVFAIAAVMPFGAQAQTSGSLPQSEWNQSFDVGADSLRPVVTATPILSPQTIPAMEQAIFLYQDLVARGGWEAVPAEEQLKIGMQSPSVAALR